MIRKIKDEKENHFSDVNFNVCFVVIRLCDNNVIIASECEADSYSLCQSQGNHAEGDVLHGQWFWFLFGGIGGAVQAAANQSPGERMALFARQHGIYIERIVQDEVIQQLKAKTAFRVTNSKQADATINLKIKTYGLSVPTTFSTGVKPMIDIEANMVDRQNQMIWANSDSVLPLSPGMPEYSTKAIGKNPQLLKKMWEAAAGKSVSNIVESL